MRLEATTWTSPSGVWHDTAPFAGLATSFAGLAPSFAGLAPSFAGLENPLLAGGLVAGRAVLAALSKPQVLTALTVGLGVGQIAGAFKSGDTFAEGWDDGGQFDQRMAMIHTMWLKLNDRLSTQCPAFMKSAYLAEYRRDRTRFSQFYAKTGKVSSRASSFVGMSPSPSGTEIGTAQTFWAELTGWIALAETMCPGKIAPGLSDVLVEASKDRSPGPSWGVLGIGAGVLLLGAYLLMRRQPTVVVQPAALTGLDFALVRRRRRPAWMRTR